MKLKQSPEDFQVEELTAVVPTRGEHALYRMEKSGWSTPDALNAVRRRWDIALVRLSYGGLKDRHARTVSHFSIHRGPDRNLQHHDVLVEYLGQIPRPYTSEDIAANRFDITLRDIAPALRPGVEERLAALPVMGVPNYFDDQRFGSVAGPGSDFIARLLVKNDSEGALKLALTGPYDFDNRATRDEKAALVKHWGDWQAAKDALPRGHARSLVDYLRVHPGDFKGAVSRLRPELRGLYLSAYQSHLWNRILARWIERRTGEADRRRLALKLGPHPFPLRMDEPARTEYARLWLPLPSARWKPMEDDPRLPLVREVVAEEGFPLEEMKVRGARDLFFSRGDRPACLLVDNAAQEWADDDRHAGKKKLRLRFDLPRGAYATLVVKAAVG
ncbi:MAG: tRNA pseudouridine(13) synthase TruD [Gemmataceae bacterium]|nr:tRNA pseudouridine(13) synthase TruD [Gemmataceae bacterium]